MQLTSPSQCSPEHNPSSHIHSLRTALQGWPEPGLHGNREAEPLQCHPIPPAGFFIRLPLHPGLPSLLQAGQSSPALSHLHFHLSRRHQQQFSLSGEYSFPWQRVTCQRLFPRCLLKQVKPFFLGNEGNAPSCGKHGASPAPWREEPQKRPGSLNPWTHRTNIQLLRSTTQAGDITLPARSFMGDNCGSRDVYTYVCISVTLLCFLYNNKYITQELNQ